MALAFGVIPVSARMNYEWIKASDAWPTLKYVMIRYALVPAVDGNTSRLIELVKVAVIESNVPIFRIRDESDCAIAISNLGDSPKAKRHPGEAK